jgi:hypothetical protein
MPAPTPVAEAQIHIEGYRELMRAFARADKDSQKFVRAAFATVGEDVAREAEDLALSKIKRMKYSPDWAVMRVGVTRTTVYVAPKKRGVKTRGPDPRRRPHRDDNRGFPDLMADRAMEPALEHNEPRLEATIERALDRIADRFDAGGPV